MKKWYEIPSDFDQCPNCGNDLEVFSDENPNDNGGYYFDGDEVRCLGRCGAKLQISVVDDGDNEDRAYVNWLEDK